MSFSFIRSLPLQNGETNCWCISWSWQRQTITKRHSNRLETTNPNSSASGLKPGRSRLSKRCSEASGILQVAQRCKKMQKDAKSTLKLRLPSSAIKRHQAPSSAIICKVTNVWIARPGPAGVTATSCYVREGPVVLRKRTKPCKAIGRPQNHNL